MSGTLLIREGVIWMPSAATVSWLLEALAADVLKFDEELSVALLDPANGHNWGFYDLRSIEKSKFQLLYKGMERIYECEVNKGIQSVGNPSSYFFYMTSLSFFKALLRTDSRASLREDIECDIYVRTDLHWTSRSWIYDLTLEYFAVFAQAPSIPSSLGMLESIRAVYNEALAVKVKTGESPSFAQELLAARTLNHHNNCDLSSLEPKRFVILLAAVKLMSTDWPVKRWGVKAPEEMAQLLPEIEELKKLFESDPRGEAN